MKISSKYFSKLTIILIVSFCLPFLAIAQVVPPDDCPDCPIDGGVIFLIAAGIGYGIKKIRDNRKQKEVEV